MTRGRREEEASPELMDEEFGDDDAPAKRRPWGPEEDDHLRELVQIYGIKSWAAIATNLSNRSGKQCRERWRNHLRPKPNKGDPLARASLLIGHYGAVEYATKYATKGSNPEEFLALRESLLQICGGCHVPAPQEYAERKSTPKAIAPA